MEAMRAIEEKLAQEQAGSRRQAVLGATTTDYLYIDDTRQRFPGRTQSGPASAGEDGSARIRSAPTSSAHLASQDPAEDELERAMNAPGPTRTHHRAPATKSPGELPSTTLLSVSVCIGASVNPSQLLTPPRVVHVCMLPLVLQLRACLPLMGPCSLLKWQGKIVWQRSLRAMTSMFSVGARASKGNNMTMRSLKISSLQALLENSTAL